MEETMDFSKTMSDALSFLLNDKGFNLKFISKRTGLSYWRLDKIKRNKTKGNVVDLLKLLKDFPEISEAFEPYYFESLRNELLFFKDNFAIEKEEVEDIQDIVHKLNNKNVQDLKKKVELTELDLMKLKEAFNSEIENKTDDEVEARIKQLEKENKEMRDMLLTIQNRLLKIENEK